MSETVVREVQIVLSAGGQFYAVLDIPRTCGLWLSIEKYPLPVPSEWHRPGLTFAAITRGRDYYRIGAFSPQHQDGSRSVPIVDELVKDWCDASWWTPGLEEAWLEIAKLSSAETHPERSEGSEFTLERASREGRSDSKKKGNARG